MKKLFLVYPCTIIINLILNGEGKPMLKSIIKPDSSLQIQQHTFEYFLQNPLIQWDNGILLVKDLNHKFISSNNNFSRFSGFSPHDLVGMCDEDMPWHDSSKIYVKHENDIISGHYYNVLEPLDGIKKTNLFTSKKIIYNNNGLPSGTIATAVFCNKQIDFTNITGTSSSLHACGYRGYNLTDSETVVLYFILKGYSRNKIAEKAKISKHAYDFHLKNLKQKFLANDKDDIIEICCINGFHDIYPFYCLV